MDASVIAVWAINGVSIVSMLAATLYHFGQIRQSSKAAQDILRAAQEIKEIAADVREMRDEISDLRERMARIEGRMYWQSNYKHHNGQ